MKAQREYDDYVRDMLDAVAKALLFTQGMDYAAFAADEKTVYAVVRALELLGEASKGIPKSVRDRYPGLPWRAMAGMRDRLIHGYFGVDLEVVWKAVQEDLPTLKPKLEQLLTETQETKQ
ncbi:MAG: DUF86 domain-containing protein [Chloroflexota bacterium]|nr:MAG: DUF86 domain-containing protein [Chloroflexota bacterium]